MIYFLFGLADRIDHLIYRYKQKYSFNTVQDTLQEKHLKNKAIIKGSNGRKARQKVRVTLRAHQTRCIDNHHTNNGTLQQYNGYGQAYTG
ncbi:MAG TPA: hypothetical protein VM187_08245, partial [Niastella sp.]|nr:hypothetical protein [Niastella sp.]